MVVIVAGSRTITDPAEVERAIQESGFPITELVSGTARGVDQLGERFAQRHGIAVRRFPADWNRFGRAAGPRRNTQMLEYAAAHQGGLVAVHDGVSRGTSHMIRIARERGLAVHVHLVRSTSAVGAH